MHKIIEEDLKNIVRDLGADAGKLEGKTLLLSGGAGFLGSYFTGVVYFLNQNFRKPCRMIILDNYITGSRSSLIHELESDRIAIQEADVTRPLEVAEPVDFIVHAAGLASPLYYRKYPLQTIDAAILGTRNLLEFARQKRVSSYLSFSSSEVYGDPDPHFIPTPESYRGNVSSIGPRACYDESKRLAETIAMIYHQIHGVPVKIVRPFNVYGPGMRTDDYRVIPTFMTQAIAGKSLPVHHEGNQTRTFCYISDAVLGFFKILLSENHGEVYNVGADAPEINMASLANMVAQMFPHNVAVELVPYPDSYPADEPNRRCPDLSKIQSHFDYKPRVSLEEGLKRTAAWFQDVLQSQ